MLIAQIATRFIPDFSSVMSRLLMLFVIGLMVGCSQASSPSSIIAQALDDPGAAAVNGLVATTIAADSNLQSRFPAMTRLQLIVTGPPGTAGLPIQQDVAIDGSPTSLQLPESVLLTVTFNAFDAAGDYIATGTAPVTIQAGVNPVISVDVSVVVLSVTVITAAGMQPISGAVVMLGNGVQSVTTDLNGVASFSAIALPQDVHIFTGSEAVSVMQFSGSALTVPVRENLPQTASITVNNPAGPTLAAGQLLNIYLSDGMSVESITGLLNDAAPLRQGQLFPMRGPISVGALIENPLEVTPKPDHGLLLTTVATGHHVDAPVNISIGDPAVVPPLTLLGQVITIASAPTGLSAVQLVDAMVFAQLPGDVYALISHRDDAVLPANRRDISLWPIAAASTYMRHITVSDLYSASSEAWQREAAPLTIASFPALPLFAPAPSILGASTALVSWSDGAGAPVWDGYVVELKQGTTRAWTIYGFQAATSVTLPTPPAGFVPLLTGSVTTATVRSFMFNLQSGFSASSPDLYYLPRMLDQRASSSPMAFTP